MSSWRRAPLQVSGGFCLLVIWFALVNGWGLLGTVLFAAGIHELGHYTVLRAFGAQVTGLRISAFGAAMDTGCQRLSYGRELASVLAGPAANLACGVALALWGLPVPAGAHLVLCGFNLLPIRPLDGGRALYLLVSWSGGPAAGERACRWVGAWLAVALATAALWLIWRTGGSLWLLPAVLGLLGAAVREVGVFVR